MFNATASSPTPAKTRTLSKGRTATLVIAIALCVIAWAPLSPFAQLEVADGSRVWVEGGSTVRSWKCEASALKSEIATNPDAALTGLADLSKVVKGVTVDIQVEKLECGNNTMNEHMRKALKAKESPSIVFNIISHELVAASDSGAGILMTGKLTIAGKTNDVVVKGQASRLANGHVKVTGTHEFPMTQFGVKPPSLMLGTMKVKDPVKVSFDITLQ